MPGMTKHWWHQETDTDDTKKQTLITPLHQKNHHHWPLSVIRHALLRPFTRDCTRGWPKWVQIHQKKLSKFIEKWSNFMIFDEIIDISDEFRWILMILGIFNVPEVYHGWPPWSASCARTPLPGYTHHPYTAGVRYCSGQRVHHSGYVEFTRLLLVSTSELSDMLVLTPPL